MNQNNTVQIISKMIKCIISTIATEIHKMDQNKGIFIFYW